MSIESRGDLDGMRAVGRVVARTLRELRAEVRPGITTAQLDEVAARALHRQGASPVPAALMAFPGSCCVSVGDEAVHGIPGPRRLVPGDLVKLDVTASLAGYVADAAITVVVPPAKPEAWSLAECVDLALQHGLRAARAGRRVSAIGRAVERVVGEQGFHVLSELCGHGTGRTLWEAPVVPNVETAGGALLTEGLVLAVEPIIASRRDRIVTAADGWTMRTRGGSLTAHAEHTVVIRQGHPLVLTAA